MIAIPLTTIAMTSWDLRWRIYRHTLEQWVCWSRSLSTSHPSRRPRSWNTLITPCPRTKMSISTRRSSKKPRPSVPNFWMPTDSSRPSLRTCSRRTKSSKWRSDKWMCQRDKSTGKERMLSTTPGRDTTTTAEGKDRRLQHNRSTTALARTQVKVVLAWESRERSSTKHEEAPRSATLMRTRADNLWPTTIGCSLTRRIWMRS